MDRRQSALIRDNGRAGGVTPRGLLDCTIVTVAWRHGARLLTRDADLHRMADVIGVPIDGV